MTTEMSWLLPDELAAARDEVRAVYAAAFAAPPYSLDTAGAAQMTAMLLRHAEKPGFRCAIARDAGGPLLGLAYGYTGTPGDWWWDRVAEALDAEARGRWLAPRCFALAELAVLPAAQGRGLGGRLHDALLAGLPEPAAALSTAQVETAALRLYRARGWVTLAEHVWFMQESLAYRAMGLHLLDWARTPVPAAAPADVSIRPFTAGDQRAVRRLILAGLGEHFGLIDETRNPDVDEIAETYLAAGHVFLVAERDGDGDRALVGTGALLVQDAGVGQIVRMSVAPSARRHGLGRALVARLLAAARERGLRRLIVETNNDWYDPIRLYVRCGFREYGRDAESLYLTRTLDGGD